jgi:hypothetical protein
MFLPTAIALLDGTKTGSGNVFAKNPVTGYYGPVCDDYWTLADVSLCQGCQIFLGLDIQKREKYTK